MAFLDKQGLERLWDNIIRKLAKKVDKVEGKSLSTNDYTTEEKEKLAGIPASENLATKTYVDEAVANVSVEVDTTLTQVGKAADAKAVGTALSNKANKTDLNSLATKTELNNYATKTFVENAVANVSVEVDTTLTQAGKAADARTVGDTINKLKNGGIEMWMILDGISVNILEGVVSDGATVNIELVDTLPNTLIPVDMENGIITLYVVKSTGIIWFDMGTGAMTYGSLAGEQLGVENFDKGWSTDINSETEDGVYCVQIKKLATEEYVDTAIANVTVEVDNTLTQEGKPADAKAVGDALANISSGTQVQIITWEDDD